MGNDSGARGLVLACDENGAVRRIVRNDPGVMAQAAPGQPFAALVDPGSRSKALSFLNHVRKGTARSDWEMNLPLDAHLVTLRFSGALAPGGMTIVGAATEKDLAALRRDVLTESDQATAMPRSGLQSIAPISDGADRDGQMYDEISLLNNELVTAQRELARRTAELERLNALMNLFLGMAAHDLRSPLNAIMAYSDFLVDEAGAALSEEQMQFLSIIRSSSEFMARLVEDLLDVASIEAGTLRLDLQPIDLVAVVRQNVTLNRALATRKSIDLRMVDDGAPLYVLADAGRIEQVLSNLMSNAQKFSNPGSIITVQVAGDDAQAVVSVQDQGQGIPADELDKLFKPFSRTTVKSTSGEKSSGLGLAIARRIATEHSGKLWVESAVGQGTTFYLALPLLTKEEITNEQ